MPAANKGLLMELSRVAATPTKKREDSLHTLRVAWKYRRRDFEPDSYAALIRAIARVFADWTRPIPDRWLPMLSEAEDELSKGVRAISSESCCGVAEALTTLRRYHSNLIGQTLEQAVTEVWKLSRKQLLALLRCSAYAPYPYRRSGVDSIIAQELGHSAPLMRKDGHDAALASWLLVINNPELARRYLAQILHLSELEFDKTGLRQLHFAALATGFPLPKVVRQQIAILLQQMAKDRPVPNGFENSVASAARTLWPMATITQQGFCAGFYPDIELRSGYNFDIEADGLFFHQVELLGDKVHLWGPTRFRHDLLTAQHRRLVHIVDLEWNNTDGAGQLELLHSRAKQYC